MIRQQLNEQKSANRLAFEHYLRTGERLTSAEWFLRFEAKFNPYHDPANGQFTFGPGGGGGARMRSASNNRQRAALNPSTTAPLKPAASEASAGRPDGATQPKLDPRYRVAEMPGYPQTERTAWRASNDQAFIAAANFYNRKYGLRPEDQDFKTPTFLKAWAMRESGGAGHKSSLRSDPFQVHNPGDNPEEKLSRIGLNPNLPMTPARSAYFALEWLRFKSQKFNDQGRVIGYRSNLEALERYNGRSVITSQSGADPHKVWYARTIFQMAAQAPRGQR